MRLHSPVTKISGPPGTGKTTAQLKIVMDLLSGGTPPEKIIFTTYTRAGAYEARDRAVVKFKMEPERFPNFTTIHALCYRRLGSRRVLSKEDMIEIGNRLGLRFTWQNPYSEDRPTITQKGDHFVQILALARMKRISLQESHRDYTGVHVPFREFQRFVEFYNQYREHYRKIDFTDMMEIFLSENLQVEGDYLIVDEAQDLAPLQWEIIKRISEGVKRTFVSGDDDQCIHAWAGANPDTLINLEGEHEILPRSYRIPKRVHELAHNIISRVPKRLDKPYLPKEEEGKVTILSSIREINLKAPGSWLLLTRNKFFGEALSEHCEKSGVLYSGGFKIGDMREATQDAIIHWNLLTKGFQISGKKAKEVYRFLKTRDRVKYGLKKKLEEEVSDDEPIDIKRLREDYGLLVCGGWEEAFMTLTPALKAFFRSAEKICKLDEPPRVRLSTIHGAKGQEADNVVVLPDMTYRTWHGYKFDRDNEHRVFYVAVTRAKKNLFLVKPETNKHYEIVI